MAQVVWTERAHRDLKEIVEYISRDSMAYARSFALRLRMKVERLAQFPKSGRTIPEDPGKGVREIIVGDYRVLYCIAARRVVILTVIHGARRLDLPFQG
ncbi:MAG: type II toxin-antitoxin system RelE/ParE family toxin [Planctomycetes bacterium]|nr:type II toxin-antitoxin system RelE/ParE family toxin [Planctomycetota bacterium]